MKSKAWCLLGCVGGMVLGACGESITFNERLVERLVCESMDPYTTFCSESERRSLSATATVRVPGLGRTTLTQDDSLTVALGPVEWNLQFAEAEPGWTQARAVFLRREYDETGTEREVGRLELTRSGDLATLVLASSDPMGSVVADFYREEPGRFADMQGGVLFRLRLAELPEVSRPVYYRGANTITRRVKGWEEFFLSSVSVEGEADFTPPQATLLRPLHGGVLRNTNMVEAVVQATDGVGVERVGVWLNGLELEAAQDEANPSRWRLPLELTPGTNTVRVYAVDRSQNVSATNTYRVVHVPTQPLTLEYLRAQGRVSGATNGQMLDVGRNHRLTASPAAEFFFREWRMESASSPPSVVTNPVLTFKMETGMVVRAVFEANRFLPIAGTYQGLFAPGDADRQESVVGMENSGSITLALTAQRRFSGRLQLRGVAYPFAGGADLEGRASVTLRPPHQPALAMDLQFHLGTNDGDNAVTGTVRRDGSWVADLLALRAARGTDLRALAGRYTFTMPRSSSPGPGEPGGAGAATGTLTAAGVMTIAGALGDGTVLNGALPFSRSGIVPIYRSLYGGRGLVWGWASLSPGGSAPILESRGLSWIRPPAVPRDSLYTNGFQVVRPLVGRRYVAPPPGTNALNWPTARGVLRLGGGNLDSEIRTDVFVAGSRIPSVSSNQSQLTLTLVPGTGALSGTFVHPVSRRLTRIRGVVLQDPSGPSSAWSIGDGWFRGSNESGYVSLEWEGTAP